MTPAAGLIDEARIAGRSAPASGGKPELVLKSSEFRKGREEGWRELEKLVGRVERRGVRSLSLDELQQLPMLYRAALSSLSVARTIALDRNLLLYLENLALRAYLAVYGPRVGALEGLRTFFVHDLPAAVRAARWHILIVTVALLVGVAAGFILTVQDEAWMTSFMPTDLAGGRGPSVAAADLRRQRTIRALAGCRRSLRHVCQRAVQPQHAGRAFCRSGSVSPPAFRRCCSWPIRA